MEIRGMRALVTGASGGIGEAIATHLASEGAHVVVTGRRKDVLEALAKKIGGTVLVADLTEPATTKKLCVEAGDIDIFVANAALPASGHLLDFDEDFVLHALHVNLGVPAIMAHHFAGQMTERKRGQIVFISSVVGKFASPGTSLYAATKFGLRGFALALRQDLESVGVGVSTIFPGFIRDAGMFARSGVKLPRGLGTRTPDDVACAVVRAVKKNSAEITVASFDQRVGAFLAGIAPNAMAAFQRAGGAHELSRLVAAGQKDIR